MRRQRADGTWTYTTPEWDDRWHWTAGTRVRVQGFLGTVQRVNQVTVDVLFDDNAKKGLAGQTRRVAMRALERPKEQT